MMAAKVPMDVYEKNFNTLRSQQGLIEDASRKGSIDAHIRHLVDTINESQNYFTTSSCSGRFLAFVQDEVHVKKNCVWIKVTHDPLNESEIDEFVSLIESQVAKYDQVLIKYEPFILHICCRSLIHAKRLLEVSIASGCRNSGISLGSSKIILAVRSTQNLECPVSESGKLIVTPEYLRFICKQVNLKFKENFERIERFRLNLVADCLNDDRNAKPLSKREEKALKRQEKAKMFAELKATKSTQESNNSNTETVEVDQQKEDEDEEDFEGLFVPGILDCV